MPIPAVSVIASSPQKVTGSVSLQTGATHDRRIVEGAAAGLRNRQIAEQLGITEAVLKVYLHRVLDRLGVTNRTELALLVTKG